MLSSQKCNVTNHGLAQIQISLPNFAFFSAKSPSVTQTPVSQENAFKKSKNPSFFFFFS